MLDQFKNLGFSQCHFQSHKFGVTTSRVPEQQSRGEHMALRSPESRTIMKITLISAYK